MVTAVVIPAKDEAARIAATVAAALPIGVVVVVDDGSSDDTAAVAERAGARVVRHPRNRGKAAAMESGAAAVPEAELLVFLDADLGATAAEGAKLARVVEAGEADAAIGTLPPVGAAGGHGFVVRLARDGIERATGWAPTQPLSGQRALSRRAFRAVLPLADGFGVETAMTIDLLLHGFRVVEVPTTMAHRVTGTGWRDQLHRARQYRDVRRALRR
ncbi:MAG TPA: glycosyltransferase [Mycobacteriales bacterium]|nr:glycosyltransferase [Mycobacteriales bacterium]